MSHLERLGARLRAHPLGVDGGLAAFVWFTTVLLTAGLFWTTDPAGLLIGTLLTVPLAWRRRAPVPAAAAVTVLALLELVLVGTFLPANVAALVMVHVMVTHDPTAASYAERVVLLADGRLAGEVQRPTAASVLEALRGLGG